MLDEDKILRKRAIKSKVIKELYAKSGNTCSFPGCANKLFCEKENISEICHIQGLNPNSARYNPNLTNDEVNDIDNLILFCPTHHSLVDQMPSKYTVKCLKQMKTKHEREFSSQIRDGNNGPKKFYRKLDKIFRKCYFDEILLEQDFCAPFPDKYLYSMEEGYLKIEKLLNKACVDTISGRKREELHSFCKLLEYLTNIVSMKCRSNEMGYAIPIYSEEDIEKIQRWVLELQKEYKRISIYIRE